MCLPLLNKARHDPFHSCMFALISLGFFLSLCGLAAIPVGDIRFELTPVTAKLNATYPTANSNWAGERIVVEFDNGAAVKEYVRQTDGTTLGRDVTRDWGSYIPGLKLTFTNSYFYQPIQEWKVVPEEMPLMWIAPMWCFLTGLLTLYSSIIKRRDFLLNALLLVGISASLLLIASHRVVELTTFCAECDAQTKYMSGDGLHLGGLPDGSEDPDLFADNNCPEVLHLKCEGGRNVYLAGSVINLIAMYIMMISIEVRRSFISDSLASHDSAAKGF